MKIFVQDRKREYFRDDRNISTRNEVAAMAGRKLKAAVPSLLLRSLSTLAR